MRDAYQEITDKIIQALESGVAPWVKPWTTVGGETNLVSKKPYRGLNTLILSMESMSKGYTSPYWLTFKQAKEKGGSVRKGEHGTHIIFWKPMQKVDDDGDVEKFVIAKMYTVFNIEQCDGIEAPAVEKTSEVVRNQLADHFIEQTGADIKHGGDRACFIPSMDEIHLPTIESFVDSDNYYATAFHELTHWSGHKSRLDRNLTGRFGSDSYAMEELVAELGAAFLCANYGVSGQLQHESYIDNWLSVLKGDKKAIFTAASKAQKAADYLIDFEEAVAEAA